MYVRAIWRSSSGYHKNVNRLCLLRRAFGSSSSHSSTSPRVMITTPIFYVNAPPHIGHLYTALMGDAVARWKRMQGHQVLFVTGTDEHGQKIAQAAKASQKHPVIFCDEISATFRQLFDDSKISYDTFIRTTELRHKNAVQHFWKVLADRGHIYESEYQGWYCVSDEAFLTDSQVIDAPSKTSPLSPPPVDDKGVRKVSAESGHPVQWLTEKNFKFRLSNFREPIFRWMDENADAIQPTSRLQEMKRFVNDGLQDLSVSRPTNRISWGIPVPNREDQTIYVWIDALTNYLTAAGYPDSFSSETFAAKISAEKSPSLFWPPQYQILGKDITRFHCVYWPALLLAAGLPLPKRLIAHAHWTVGRTKMSKSLGNIVPPAKIISQYGLDAVRFFLLREGGLENDGDYSDAALEALFKSFLADTLGNLVGRVTAKSMNELRAVPQADPRALSAAEKRLIDAVNAIPIEVGKYYDRLDFRNALNLIAELCTQTNKYFTDSAPWALRKRNETAKLRTVLYVSLDAVRVIALLLLPIMPDAASTILDRLGVPLSQRTAAQLTGGLLSVGSPLKSGEVLFKKKTQPGNEEMLVLKKQMTL